MPTARADVTQPRLGTADGGDGDHHPDPDEPLDLSDLFRKTTTRSLRRLPRLLSQAIRLVWRAARREFVRSGVLQIVAGLGVAAQLLVGRRAMELLFDAETRSLNRDVVIVLAALVTITAVVAFANLARAEQQRVLGELVAAHTTDKVLEVSTAVDLVAYESSAFHNRLQRAAVNAASRPSQMATGLFGLVSAGLSIAGIAGALLVIEPLFLALIAIAYIPVWLATTRASRVVYDFTREQTERDRERSYLFWTLTRKEEAAEIRAFSLASVFRHRHGALYDERIGALRTMVRRRLKFGLFGAAVNSLLMGGTLLFIVWLVDGERMTLSSAGAAAAAILLLGQRLQLLSTSAGSLYESSMFLEDFTSFIEVMPRLERARAGGAPPAPFRVLRVDDVSFTYPTRHEPSVRGVSFEIRAGEVIALVGENGSGKTTLAKLLAGLYTPGGGSITWDGIDVTSFAPHAMRESVAVIFQDFVHYLLKARDNIAAGDFSRADDLAAIEDAARASGADSFLRHLPQGYETRLGSQFFGGSELSIGQWQRVAIARAFFRDAPLLILDEPTAALDPRSEAELFENIRDLQAGRTVVLISHRFSSVRSADRILVLHEGVLVESGTHEQLMLLGGRYATLFTLQAASYVD